MAGLSNFELLEVNATIIVGLVLLFTFQSFSSILAPGYNSYFEDLSSAWGDFYKAGGVMDECLEVKKNEAGVKEAILSTFLEREDLNSYEVYHEKYADELISETNNKCKTVWYDYASARQNIVGLLDYGERNNYISKEVVTSAEGIFAGEDTDVPTTAANVQVVIATIVMIMPFTISSIVAIQHASKSSIKDESSKVALRIMLAGFFVMISGFLYIGFIFFNISGWG